MSATRSLKGEHWLITGASRGIGAALAQMLARQGAALTLIARDLHAMQKQRDTLIQLGANQVDLYSVDLSNQTETIQWAQEWAQAQGSRIRGVIHNAGLDLFVRFEILQPELICDQLNLNLTAPLVINRVLLPHLDSNHPCHIIHMSSVAAFFPVPFGAVYSATKSGLASANEALAIEYANSHVQFSTIAPGFVHGTGMHERHKDVAGTAPSMLGGTQLEDVLTQVMRLIKDGRGRSVIVNRLPTRPLIALTQIFPRFYRFIATRLVRPYISKIAHSYQSDDH